VLAEVAGVGREATVAAVAAARPMGMGPLVHPCGAGGAGQARVLERREVPRSALVDGVTQPASSSRMSGNFGGGLAGAGSLGLRPSKGECRASRDKRDQHGVTGPATVASAAPMTSTPCDDATWDALKPSSLSRCPQHVEGSLPMQSMFPDPGPSYIQK